MGNVEKVMEALVLVRLANNLLTNARTVSGEFLPEDLRRRLQEAAFTMTDMDKELNTQRRGYVQK